MVAEIVTLYPGKSCEELAKCPSGPSVNERQDTVPSIADLIVRFNEKSGTAEPPRQVASLAVLGRIYFL